MISFLSKTVTLTRPVRAELPRYLEIEEPLQDCILAKFLGQALSPAEYDQVFEIDDAILAHEFINLMDAKIIDPAPSILSQPEFAFTVFKACAGAFLELFGKLTA